MPHNYTDIITAFLARLYRHFSRRKPESPRNQAQKTAYALRRLRRSQICANQAFAADRCRSISWRQRRSPKDHIRLPRSRNF